MARGFVKKRGEVWYAYWRDQAGKQHAKAVGARKKDAEAYLVEMQKDVNENTFREIKQTTFEAFAMRWLDDYAAVQVKPSTLTGYRSSIRSTLIPYFGNVKLSGITTAQVQRFVADRLAEGRAPSTVQKDLVILKGMLDKAVDWNFLKANPAAKVKPPRKEHKEMDFLTPGEIRLFLAALPDEWKAFFTTAILTGMRLGELRALQWSDIDWNSGTIRVRRTVWRGTFQEPKSVNGRRSVTMSPVLEETLREHRKTAPASADELVFCTRDGKVIDDSNLRHRVFEPALREAGLRKLRIHDLRHTYASLLINQGENLKYVQHQLGHASITTTVDRYGHLMPDAQREAGARLDASVFG